MKKIVQLFLVLLTITAFQNEKRELLRGKGNVEFISSAPLETIKASSDELKGIIDISNNSFAFTFPVNSFKGFNSPLQKEHFEEHYLDTRKFPNSTFTGKIIDFKPCDKNCKYDAIAKGKLTIHGVTKVVSIPAAIEKLNEDYLIRANFEIKLQDYDIEIPLILEGKISPLINVSVDAKFQGTND